MLNYTSTIIIVSAFQSRQYAFQVTEILCAYWTITLQGHWGKPIWTSCIYCWSYSHCTIHSIAKFHDSEQRLWIISFCCSQWTELSCRSRVNKINRNYFLETCFYAGLLLLLLNLYSLQIFYNSIKCRIFLLHFSFSANWANIGFKNAYHSLICHK